LDDAVDPDSAAATAGRSEIGVNAVDAQQVVRGVIATAKAVVAQHEIGVVIGFDQGGKTLYGLFTHKRRMSAICSFNELPGTWSGPESVSGKFGVCG